MAESFPSSDSTSPPPAFPRFKPLVLEDREIFRDLLWAYQPETSELTFTNLFMWQSHYGYQWCLDRDRLLVVSTAAGRRSLGPAARGSPAPGRSLPPGFGVAEG